MIFIVEKRLMEGSLGSREKHSFYWNIWHVFGDVNKIVMQLRIQIVENILYFLGFFSVYDWGTK